MAARVFSSLDDPELGPMMLSGAVGVIPTDTVYGLVCRAEDVSAIQKLFVVKGREENPGTVLATSIQQLIDLGLKRRYLKSVEYLWPNAISVVIPCGEELAYLHMGKYSLAVRIPDDTSLRGLLQRTGPLMTTSANYSRKSTVKSCQEAVRTFGDAIDFYVDGGSLDERSPSTIIRIVDDSIEIIRKGAVSIDELGRITNR